MSLPALINWDNTRLALHQAAQVVGAIRKIGVPPQPNYAHLGLFVTPTGLSSRPLHDGGGIDLNFAEGAVIYTCPANSVSAIPIIGQTQTTLTDAVLKAMHDAGHPANPDRSSISATDELKSDQVLGAEYAIALYRIYTALARFGARLSGGMTPLIVWPHGFDLSMLWFKRGFDEKTDPHTNIGFSPGSAGFPRPYVYLYLHPMPSGLTAMKLPAPFRWHTQGWTGAVIDYDALLGESDVESMLEALLFDVYKRVEPLLE